MLLAMSMSPQVTNDPLEKVLRSARVIWAGLLLGQIAFAGAIGFLITRGDLGFKPGEASRLLTRISFGLLVLMVPLAYFVRGLIFRPPGEGEPLPPRDYLRGTIVFLAMCEGVALFGLVTTLLNGSFFPPAITTLIALIVQAMNFPDGREVRAAGTGSDPIEPS